MNIDFIKWMVENADGFEWFISPDRGEIFKYCNLECYLSSADAWYLYPLLLQRAIEGVNREENCYLIMQNHRGLYYNTYEDPAVYDDYESIDQAKESALKYIYEQEPK